MPRVLFESWSGEDYLSIFTIDQEQLALAKVLASACKKHNFDGFVVELWLNFGGKIPPSKIVALIQRLGKKKKSILQIPNYNHFSASSLKRHNLEFILVVPPKRQRDNFDNSHYEQLYDYVAGFSLMTYDFSNPQRPGVKNRRYL